MRSDSPTESDTSTPVPEGKYNHYRFSRVVLDLDTAAAPLALFMVHPYYYVKNFPSSLASTTDTCMQLPSIRSYRLFFNYPYVTVFLKFIMNVALY